MVSAVRRKVRYRDRAFGLINGALFILIAVVSFYPFWHVLMASVSNPFLAAEGGFFLIPRGSINLQAYEKVLTTAQIFRSYINTIFVVVVGTVLNMLFTTITAYALSKTRVKGVTVITLLIVFTMIFRGGMIPTFLVVRTAGLLNRLWAMILPFLIIPFNMFVLRNFFAAIPESIEEAAQIDGCSTPRTLFQIILPLSVASLVTIGLFYAVYHWNNFRACMLYINNDRKYVLQLVLRNLYLEGDTTFMDMAQESTEAFTPESIKMATVMVATIPIMLAYPFIQKYFVKGIVVGSLKG